MSALVLTSVTIAIYRPALQIGFWTDDFMFLDWAIRRPLLDYLINYFDPRLQWIWYRPMQGVEFWIQYIFFGSNPIGYHVVQLFLHVANVLILFGLVAHISRRWRLAFMAGIIYATLPTYSLAIYWATVAEPLVTFFYLATLALWIGYLESGSRARLVLTYIAFVCALLSKEAAATLPIMLFLIDRWLLHHRAPFADLVKRYAGFVLVLFFYSLLIFKVITQGAFVRDSGYGIGLGIFSVFFQYLARLIFPWGMNPPFSYLLFAFVGVGFAYAVFRRYWSVVFLGVAAIVAQSPLFPFRGVILRYTYFPLMASAVGYALCIEIIMTNLKRLPILRLAQALTAVALVLLVVASGQTIGQDAESMAGFVRETRLKVQPIFQLHPGLPPDTYLYFIDPPFLTLNLSGLIAERYGNNALVSGIDYDREAHLRDHTESFIYYMDDQNTLREQTVDPRTSVRVMPSLPVHFEDSISLQGFEVASAIAKVGEAFVLLLYWRADRVVGKDYTVFAHLVDQEGKMISGYDSQPKRGKAPTSTWKPGSLITDAVILPIDSSQPNGDGYHIELGLYYLPTMQRLSIINATGQPTGDTVILKPFSIVP